jgi:hypothetical protein
MLSAYQLDADLAISSLLRDTADCGLESEVDKWLRCRPLLPLECYAAPRGPGTR